MQSKIAIRLVFTGSFAVWVAMAFCDVVILLSNLRNLDPGIPLWLPRALMALYVLLLFYYYKMSILRHGEIEFTDLLWRVLIVGLPLTAISLAVRLVLYLLGDTKFSSNPLFIDIIYNINMALFISFLMAAFTSWKRLILYQQSKNLIRLWNLFEAMLLLALLYDTVTVSVYDYIEKAILIGIGVLVVILSTNVKWIAYLTTRQKWISLLFVSLIFCYLYYFRDTVVDLSEQLSVQATSFINFVYHPFALSIFGFVMLYSTFSFFVTLFNLPTSSAFKQKLGEAGHLKRISQSAETEKNEENIYRILLDGAVDSTSADSAWIDTKSITGENQLFTYNLKEESINPLKQYLEHHDVGQHLIKSAPKPFYMRNIHVFSYRSILIFPLLIKGEIVGTLMLLKALSDGFNREMFRVVEAFSDQTRISVENFRLLEQAFQHERYKEALKIAKKTHDKLLPKQLEQDKDFDIIAFSRSPDEVGGDYYDAIRIGDNKVALVLADVSGKGITAAFHMAQLKGIFHSLARQGLSPKEFLTQANAILVSCLERGTFISAIYFIIDTSNKKITYTRAGHCPILYFCGKQGTAQFLNDRGTILGVLHNADYTPRIETKEINYTPDDVMLLYTDGVTEAKNKNGEEYGYERLKRRLLEVVDKPVRDIQTHLIARLRAYSGSRRVQDDYTTVIVKFKHNSQVPLNVNESKNGDT